MIYQIYPILIIYLIILYIYNKYNESFIQKKKKILIIANMELFKQHVSSARYEFLLYLNSKPNIIVTGPGMPNFKKNITQDELINNLYQDKKPDVVYFYIISIFSYVNDLMITNINTNYNNVLWFEDIYHNLKIVKFMKQHNIHKLLLNIKHNKIEKNLNKYLNSVKTFNYYINTNIYYNYNIPKIYDILLYGYTNKVTYPFRNRLFKLIQKNNNLFRVKYIKHPGYYKTNKTYKNIENSTNQNLAKLINQSYITICTKSKHNVLLKKYFEVSCCNSLIAGNIPSDYKDIFNSNTIILLEDHYSDEKIIEILTESLLNKKRLLQMSLKLNEIVSKQFNFKKGYKKLCNVKF